MTYKVRVSCVQRNIQPVNSIGKYINMLCGFLEQAKKEGSHLIVFPEYNFLDLLGIIPGFFSINQFINQKEKGNIKKKSQKIVLNKRLTILTKIFKNIAGPIETGIIRIVAILAQSYDIFIYSGSYILKENEKIYNAGSLFSPEGQLIGTQKKLHLTDFEDDLGIERGFCLKSFSLPFGTLVCPICMDATYFETFRIARECGADIIILPIANLEEYNEWKARRGIWPRVQESFVYGLKSSLTGWIMGMHFTGKAGIFAPLPLTQKKDGVISISSFPEGNELVTAEIDIKKLHKARRLSEYHEDKNEQFEKNFIELNYMHQ